MVCAIILAGNHCYSIDEPSAPRSAHSTYTHRRHELRTANISGDVAMQRSHYALIVATLFALSFVSHAARADSLTRERVRADLIAAELKGTFPPSKGNKPDPALSYIAKKATLKAEKN